MAAWEAVAAGEAGVAAEEGNGGGDEGGLEVERRERDEEMEDVEGAGEVLAASQQVSISSAQCLHCFAGCCEASS